jgi:hypothetical protein
MTQKFEMFMNQMHGNRIQTQNISRLKTENLPTMKEFSDSFKPKAEDINLKMVNAEFNVQTKLWNNSVANNHVLPSLNVSKDPFECPKGFDNLFVSLPNPHLIS